MKAHQELSDPAAIRALSHPLRVQILGVLERGPASPNAIAKELDAPLGTVAYHMRELLRHDFVELERTAPRRGAVEHYYKAKMRPRISDAGWAAAPTAVKSAMVRSALEQISTFVNAAALDGGFDAKEAHLNRMQVVVDERGLKELSQELWRVLKALPKIEEASRKRLARNNHSGEQTVTVVTMAFEAAEPMLARPRRKQARKRAKNA
jgi:DNA-binding transcriptional ArsR family regulator